jgi:hypothetical protein
MQKISCSLRFLFLLILPASAFAQLLPVSAHAVLYFPHFADGGSPAQQWQTTFTFVNPSSSPVDAQLNLLDNDGQPLALDLGSGLTGTLNFTVPANGLQIFRSRIASPSIVTGWAFAIATYPLDATVAFRAIANGKAQTEVTAEPTLPTPIYMSAASPFLGIALANGYGYPINVQLTLHDSNGSLVGTQMVVIAPRNHTSFTLANKFPALSTSFIGTVSISGIGPNDWFLAWTLNGDSLGVISALPPGRSAWPVSQFERILDVYETVLRAAAPFIGPQAPTLQIPSDPIVNAYAQGGNTVAIYLALAELISDSPSELAFAIGHELGHIYQQRNGGRLLYNPDLEFDADTWGLIFSIAAEYDPYASAGTLSKLAMATGTAGLTTQFEQQLSGDAHQSFNTRLASIFNTISLACSDPAVTATCNQYKSLIHPHLPSTAPLLRKEPSEPR